jgi:hypothetical protein
MSKSMFIVSIIVGLMIGIAFGSSDATAGVLFSDMAPCQKILLKRGSDKFPFITGYRCKGYESAEPGVLIDECSCYQFDTPNTFIQHGTGDACDFLADCACDGFSNHFNTSKTHFLCTGEAEDGIFAHRDDLFWLWKPGIEHHSFSVKDGNTANLTCFPDRTCQTACEGCPPLED